MQKVPQLPTSVAQFFYIFSRMEYALKRVARYRSNDRGFVKADWIKFAQSPKVIPLFAQLSNDDEARYLIEQPPAKLVLVNEVLEFGAPPPPCVDMEDVCRSLTHVRNNLFHGEKGSIIEPRDIALVKASVRTLDLLVSADAEVERNYGVTMELR